MPTVDVVLLLILMGFVLYGFWFGFIHALGGLVGVVLGTLFASRLYEPVAHWLAPLFDAHPNTVRILAFSIAFILINRVVGFGFWVLERIFRIIAIIPFLKTINRLAGALFGFLEGAFVLGGILFILARFPIDVPWERQLQESNLAHQLVRAYSVMTPLLPQALRDFDPSSFFKK
ncbi:CvpA family protein [Candidatus Uhrbacteria bacterium]|nr:CvpA family protein [Candidatus Uhrbacteria bacterium]